MSGPTTTSRPTDAEPEDRLSIPDRVEEVTPQWLTAALAVRYPGTEVLRVDRGTTVHGSGTKVRLLLDYNAAGHRHRLPPTMWIKAGYEPHSDMIRNSYVAEKHFYRAVGRSDVVNAPYLYFGGTDPSTGHTLLLLEDLLARNATFGHATAPLDVATAERALAMMARYHGLWWGAPELATLGDFGGAFVTDDIIYALIDSEGWEHWVAQPRGSAVPDVYRSRDAIRRAYGRLWELERQATPCMLHGDAHLGNMFFELDGRPGFLDWQRVMQGHWAHDVAYFTISALEPAVAAEHEQQLLGGYVTELARSGGPELGHDEAWLAYRRQAVHGLVWVINPLTMQPEAVNTTNARRFGSAVDRLNSWSALFEQAA